MSATEILAKARELPAEERREIAEALLDEVDLTPEQAAELDRRTQDALANPGRGMPIEEIAAEIRQRFPRK